MRTLRSLTLTSLVGLTFAIAACTGGTPTTTETPVATAEPTAKATTDAQLKLAHFRTADGMVGFTLDRSGEPLKLQMDGEKDIIELTQKEERDQRGELVGYKLLDPSNKPRILISVGGSITLVRGKDELPVTSDKGAAPLGAPTIAGKAVEKPAEPSAAEKLAAELAKVSVRVKMPEMKSEDVANLAKVEAAFAKADASMFVRYKKPDSNGWPARSEVVPSQFSGMAYGGGDFATDEDEAARHKALAKHGGRMIGVSSPERDMGNHILVRRIDKEKKDELADKTPGILWEIDGTRAAFVTFDGARYSVDLNQGGSTSVPIERGAGPEAGWPAALQDTYGDITYFSSLAKAGALPQKTVDDLDAIDQEWNGCVAKAWKPKRIAQNVNFPAEAVKIHKSCNKFLDKFETALVKLIDERVKARKALHDKAVAKAKEVGAAK